MTTRALTLALTTLLTLAARGALAAPAVCRGRFDVDGAALDVGAPVDPVTSIRIRTTSGPADEGGFAVRLADACDSVSGVQIPRSDVFVVRSRFAGCGERPRFRVRLSFSRDCATVTGRVRSAGQLVAQFTAHHVLDTPISPVSADAPSITGFDPGSGLPGDTITIVGQHFDHDRLGSPQDVPAYVVLFQGVTSSSARVPAAFAVVSPEELSVVVPDGVVSGLVLLAERFPGGATGQVFARSPQRFLIRGPFPPSTTSTTTTPVATTTSTTRHTIVRPTTTTSTSSTSTTSTTRHSTTTTSRPPTTTTRPTTTTTSRPPTTTTLAPSATVTFQPTNLSLFTAGTFNFVASGPNQQIGALFDGNQNHVVDGFQGDPTLPWMRFPVPNASNTGFNLAFGSRYEQNANAVVGATFGANDSAFIDVHFVVSGNVATPIFMSGGALVGSGIVESTDASGITEHDVQVIPATATSPRIIRGHVAGVMLFTDVDGTTFGDGVVLDFVLPLPNDA